MLCFFFFKQETAYEMRISDWSSDVCSSDLLPGHRAGVVARAVYEDEALGGHRLGILIDAHEVGGAALGGSAQRLLQDGGEAAGLVAGRGIVVHLAAVAPDVVLPPADALDQLLADGARGGAPGQQMLGPVDPRRSAQDRSEERRVGKECVSTGSTRW